MNWASVNHLPDKRAPQGWFKGTIMFLTGFLSRYASVARTQARYGQLTETTLSPRPFEQGRVIPHR